MKIQTCISYLDKSLEPFRPDNESTDWQLVVGGYWSDSAVHNGYVTYYLAKDAQGRWILDCVSRNACLDDLTEEDVEDGRLNDDQAQALFGMTLEEAQNQHDREIVAVGFGAADDTEAAEAAELLYDAVISADGILIEEPEESGLL